MEAKTSCICTSQWTSDNKYIQQRQGFAFNQKNERKDWGNSVLGILCRAAEWVGLEPHSKVQLFSSCMHFYRARGKAPRGFVPDVWPGMDPTAGQREKVFCCLCCARSGWLKDYRLLWPFCPESRAMSKTTVVPKDGISLCWKKLIQQGT